MERNEGIDRLLERYFSAQTTEAEERTLCEYFRQTQELPAGLRDVQTMFAGLDALSGERMPRGGVFRRRRGGLFRGRSASVWGIAAAAAVALGLFFAADLLRTPYCYIDGKAVYDKEVALGTTVYLEGLAELDAPGLMLDKMIENQK